MNISLSTSSVTKISLPSASIDFNSSTFMLILLLDFMYFQKCFGLVLVSLAIDSYLNLLTFRASLLTMLRTLLYSVKTVGSLVSIYLVHNLCFLFINCLISLLKGCTA